LAAARDPEVLGLLAAAQGPQRRPNLLLAAVHYLLLGGDPHPLGRFYPSLDAERARGDPWPVFRAFVLSRRADLQALIARRHTQTNEVRRSAVLYPAIALAARELAEPTAILEAGAAAGLNLLFDRYWFDYAAAGTAGDPASPVRARCQVRGRLRPPISQPAPQVAARLGIDAHPLDIRDADQVLWLRSLVWPEHHGRVELLQNAIAVARRDLPPLDHGTLPEAVTEAGRASPQTARWWSSTRRPWPTSPPTSGTASGPSWPSWPATEPLRGWRWKDRVPLPQQVSGPGARRSGPTSACCR
jgi:hypothetical protein